MTIIRYFLQLCLGLSALHKRKIIHGNLNSATIWMSEKRDRVQIGNLGCAKTPKTLLDASQSENSAILKLREITQKLQSSPKQQHVKY